MNKFYLVPVIGLSAIIVGCGQNVTVNVPASPSEVKVIDEQATAKGLDVVINELKSADIQVTAKGLSLIHI